MHTINLDIEIERGQAMNNSVEDIFGEVISAYSRAQAIEDGVLVDIEPLCNAFHLPMPFHYPTVLTSAVYEKCVNWTDEDGDRTGQIQDQPGRLHDVLYMAVLAAKRDNGGDRCYYKISCITREEGKREEVDLVCHIGPGDTPAPVITIMFPNEN